MYNLLSYYYYYYYYYVRIFRHLFISKVQNLR
jgi:hypothetical protein